MPDSLDVQIDRLSVESYESGFAIGHASPRLSWRFKGDTRDWKQASYDIVVERGGHKHESSVTSDQSRLVQWPVEPLKARERAKVAVRAKGRDGSTTEWASLDLETALLSSHDWTAVPVTGEKQSVSGTKQPFQVRKTFDLRAKPSRARLYVTSLGLYDATINGKRVGDHVLGPGWQSYKHHLNFQTFDVSDLLQVGENVIASYVGSGWYSGRLGWREGHRNVYGERNAFMAQLEGDDGELIVATDSSWEWSYGNILAAELYDGETFDSRPVKETWSPVDVLERPSAELISTESPPVRRIQEIVPKKIIKTPSGRLILDLGQNMVGWMRFNKQPSGPDGSEVVLSHAEVLEHGELGTRPLRAAKAQDKVILGGDLIGYEPRFTFHGFRYVQVDGWSEADLDLECLTGVVIHTDMERLGTFACSHPMIEQLYSNVNWSMKGNFVSIPSDCPQRDER